MGSRCRRGVHHRRRRLDGVLCQGYQAGRASGACEFDLNVVEMTAWRCIPRRPVRLRPPCTWLRQARHGVSSEVRTVEEEQRADNEEPQDFLDRLVAVRRHSVDANHGRSARGCQLPDGDAV